MRRALILAAVGLAVAAGLAVVLVAGAGLDATLRDVGSLERWAPERTALMRRRIAEARSTGRTARVDQRWVPYGRISPRLRRAVLIAEDDAFFSHGGLDWEEIQASMRHNLRARRIVRGGSTITQQLARNLYLGNERTVIRKVREVLLAGRLERALTKRRIFELYLNLIEWGDGIYGIEAAAQRHFGVPAAALDARRSALLAAVIINPRRFDPARPDRRIERRARMILSRMRSRGFIGEAEYRAAVGLPPLPDTTGVAIGDSLGPASAEGAGAPADSAAPPGPEDGMPSPPEPAAPDSAPPPAAAPPG